MKKIVFLVLLLVLVTGCSTKGLSTSLKSLFIKENAKTTLITGKINAEIIVKDYGTIKLELDGDTAPITVSNFVTLAKSGFYDNLTFHRIMEGFMIQGGDPEHNGNGGSPNNIKGEFKDNGVENNISHKRGVISMARRGGYPDTEETMNSASSQFFIVHQDSTFLDGKYASFGYVTEGMNIVDKIATTIIPIDENGTVPFENQPVIETVKIIE